MQRVGKPTAGGQYTEGRIRSIGFYDPSRVVSTSQATCARPRCFQHVLVVDEWSPGNPGHQIKYYAPGVGLVRVGARGGDSQEYLSLTAVRHLGRAGMARVPPAATALANPAHPRPH